MLLRCVWINIVLKNIHYNDKITQPIYFVSKNIVITRSLSFLFLEQTRTSHFL